MNQPIWQCGLQLPDPTKVSSVPAFESVPSNVISDGDIISLITDPDRTPRAQEFDDHWVVEGDQKQHGSCNGWATASVLSKTRWLRGIRDGLVLSGSYVYSLLNGGRDNGSALADDIDELVNNGAPPASTCGPNTIWRADTKKFDAEAAKHKGFACYAAKTKDGFRSGIALGHLGVVAVQVDQTKFVNFKDSTGDAVLPAFNGVGNHAIHVHDMRIKNGVEQFQVVNNWGLSWGYRGMAWVTWASFAQTFSVHQFYLITSTTEAGG